MAWLLVVGAGLVVGVIVLLLFAGADVARHERRRR